MRHLLDLPDLPALAFRKAFGKNRAATLEGGKGGGAPSAPDPYTVAGATTQTNEQTAQFNKTLNLNNYSNPFGSQSTVKTGTDPTTGAPIYQTSITANPQLASAIGNLLTQTGNSGAINATAMQGLQNVAGGLGGVASGQEAVGTRLGDLSDQTRGLAASLNPAAAQQAGQKGQDAAYAAQTQYLDPQFSQEQTSLESQLANQGLTPGSQAYTNAMTNFNNAKQRAYSNAANEAVLTGNQIGTQNWQNQLSGVDTQANTLGLAGQQMGQQAALYGLGGQALTQQAGIYGQQAGIGQMPYSNLTTLAGLVPGNTGTAQSAASPANIAQAFQNQYAGELNQYNANVGASNSMMGGLFGLGSAGVLALAASDRRLKSDIERTGDVTADGLPLYRYRYLWDAPHVRRIGVMADEARIVRPDAVAIHPSGFDMVDYSKLAEARHAG